MKRAKSWAGWVAIAAAVVGSGCAVHPHVRAIEAFREAKKRGDYDIAATYLAPEARVWFEKKEGPGRPVRPQGGPYAEWDKLFNARSTPSSARVGRGTVSYVISETNDYYRLIDRVPGRVRMTYYFADDGKIAGYLVQGLTPPNERPPDRRCEFEKWAAGKYPGLLDSEEMEIPNNPRRWRELLIEWRAEVGLPEIPLE